MVALEQNVENIPIPIIIPFKTESLKKSFFAKSIYLNIFELPLFEN